MAALKQLWKDWGVIGILMGANLWFWPESILTLIWVWVMTMIGVGITMPVVIAVLETIGLIRRRKLERRG